MESRETVTYLDISSYNENNIPFECFCPILQEIMQDPVLTSDGHTYERTAIQRWFDLGKRTSPKTGVLLINIVLIPNHSLRNLIEELKEKIPQLAMNQLLDEKSIATAINLCEENLKELQNEKIILINGAKKEAIERIEDNTLDFKERMVNLEEKLHKGFEEKLELYHEKISVLETDNAKKDQEMIKLSRENDALLIQLNENKEKVKLQEKFDEEFKVKLQSYIQRLSDSDTNKQPAVNNILKISKDNQQIKNNNLLDSIGKMDDDAYILGEINVTRGEIKYSIVDSNNYYTADFINVLLFPLSQGDIKIYPAVTIESIGDYYQKIQEQNECYVFVPLNVAYDEKNPQHKNHWAALIIDKTNELLFYFDPAKKTKLPEKLVELKYFLSFKKPIIMNPIDFQQNEKKEGWIRHCGPYVIEIFKVFANSPQCISGSILADPEIPDSISAQTILSSINCGGAENIKQIRETHIEEAHNFIVPNPAGHAENVKSGKSYNSQVGQSSEYKKPNKLSNNEMEPKFSKEFDEKHKLYNEVQFSLEENSAEKDQKITDFSNWKIYKRPLLQPEQQYGCSVFLMFSNNIDTVLVSNKSHLYLYQNIKGFFYFVENNEKKQYLPKDFLPGGYLSEDGVRRFFEHAGFDQLVENPVECTNQEICSAVLKVTSKKGHTQKYPFMQSKKGIGIIDPNRFFQEQIKQIQEDKYCPSIRQSLAFGFDASGVVLIPFGLALGILHIGINDINEKRDGVALTHLFFVFTLAVNCLLTGYAIRPTTESEDKNELYNQLNKFDKYIAEEIDQINKFAVNNILKISEDNQPIKINNLLDSIGKMDDDVYTLGGINITRGEVKYSIVDSNNYYTADFINVLLFPMGQGDIKIYPAVTIENIGDYYQDIQEQNERYVFVPLNVAYDEKNPQHKNHWAALIIDKINELLFYLDPAKKTKPPEKLVELKYFLSYKKSIIINPIDFQQNEKKEGWIRHCGPYVIEIFKVFANPEKCVSGSVLADSDIPDSISAQTILSTINCGDAENIKKIREIHIEEAYNFIVLNSAKNPENVRGLKFDSTQVSHIYEYKARNKLSNNVIEPKFAKELEDKHKPYNEILPSLEKTNAEKYQKITEFSSWKIYKRPLLQPEQQYGCSVFLMFSNNIDTILVSNKSNLYLYQNIKGFFYFVVNNEKKQYLPKDFLPRGYLSEDGVRRFFEHAGFDQLVENPAECTNQEICSAVLRVTSKKGHTQKYPFIQSKKQIGIIDPNRFFKQQIEQIQEDKCCPSIRQSLAFAFEASGVILIPFGLALGALYIGINEINEERDGVALTHLFFVFTMAVTFLLTGYTIQPTTESEDKAELYSKLNKFDKYIAEEIDQIMNIKAYGK